MMDIALTHEAHRLVHSEKWSTQATHNFKRMLHSRNAPVPPGIRSKLLTAWLSNNMARKAPGHKNPRREQAQKDYKELTRMLDIDVPAS